MEFNGIQFDCYQDNDNNGEFFGTREQIGRMLEYSEPRIAIDKIHDRNAIRLNKFSTVTNLVTVEGNREVTRDTIVYSFKGLLEICRLSSQPRADAVMDFLWEVADSIRKSSGLAIIDTKLGEDIQKEILSMITNEEIWIYMKSYFSESSKTGTIKYLIKYWEETNKHIIELREIKKRIPYKSTTWSRIDILAAIHLLEDVSRNVLDTVNRKISRIQIFTESRPVTDVINQGWLRRWENSNWITLEDESVKNQDLWKRIASLLEEFQQKSIICGFSFTDHNYIQNMDNFNFLECETLTDMDEK